MKKILLFFFIIHLCCLTSNAETTTLQASATFNWDTISQEERIENISQIKSSIFGDSEKTKKLDNFKELYKDFLKDKNYKKHYLVASSGYKEYKNFNIAAMYYKKMSTLYMYALQPKDNLTTIYYYDTLGNLRYVDNLKGNYPDFPYYTEQYRRSGKLVGISYFVSKDTQYIFKPNGEFKGVWHKEKFFDLDGKIKMQRSNY